MIKLIHQCESMLMYAIINVYKSTILLIWTMHSNRVLSERKITISHTWEHRFIQEKPNVGKLHLKMACFALLF